MMSTLVGRDSDILLEKNSITFQTMFTALVNNLFIYFYEMYFEIHFYCYGLQISAQLADIRRVALKLFHVLFFDTVKFPQR